MQTKPDTEHVKGMFTSKRLFVIGNLNFPGLAAEERDLCSSPMRMASSLAPGGNPHILLRGDSSEKSLEQQMQIANGFCTS